MRPERVASALGMLTWTLLMPILVRLSVRRESRIHEAHIPAERSPPEEDPWFSKANDNERRAEGLEAEAGERTKAADRLKHRLARRDRLTRGGDFQALFQHGNRVDRPSFLLLWRETSERRRSGFAVSRQIRGAVHRNRARRRLREAFRRAQDVAPTKAALIFIAKAGVLRQDFRGLIGDVETALAAVTDSRASR